MTIQEIQVLIQRLIDFWSESKITIRPGVRGDAIEKFEETYAVSLPKDMCIYLSSVDGMMEGEMDPTYLIRFWPLKEIKRVVEEFPDLGESVYGYFLFSDYSIWAHEYAINLSSDMKQFGSVVIVGGETLLKVASSFTEFLARYLDEPERLF